MRILGIEMKVIEENVVKTRCSNALFKDLLSCLHDQIIHEQQNINGNGNSIKVPSGYLSLCRIEGQWSINGFSELSSHFSRQ